MSPKSKDVLEVKPLPQSDSSPNDRKKASTKTPNYGSEGVKNHDIFSLPTADYKILALVTIVAATVRLFRIYQPPSVVFDEVQYVPAFSVAHCPLS